jgi:hypothetical protein
MSTVDDRHCISVLSLGEIRNGIEILRRKSPDQCPAFESWLNKIRTDYHQKIIPISEEIVDEWGKLMPPQTMPVTDSLIVATALEHSLTAATRIINRTPHLRLPFL